MLIKEIRIVFNELFMFEKNMTYTYNSKNIAIVKLIFKLV